MEVLFIFLHLSHSPRLSHFGTVCGLFIMEGPLDLGLFSHPFAHLLSTYVLALSLGLSIQRLHDIVPKFYSMKDLDK